MDLREGENRQTEKAATLTEDGMEKE